jgi:sugar phosphate isomerase/epimerase
MKKSTLQQIAGSSKTVHIVCCLLLTINLVAQNTKQTAPKAPAAVPAKQNIAKNWKLGVASWTFHNFTFQETLAKLDSANIEYVEAFAGQKSIAALNDTVIGKLSLAGADKLKHYLDTRHIKMASMYAFGGNTVAAWKNEFEMAKRLGLKFITGEPPASLYKSVDSLAGIYKIKVAIHNHWKEISPASWHPDTLLVTLRKYHNFGACADVGHMYKSGVEPVEAIKKLKGHILAIHLKDIGEKNNPKVVDVPVGTGIVNFPEIFKELKRQHFAGYIYIERDADEKPSNLPSVIGEIKYYNKQLGLKPHVGRKK